MGPMERNEDEETVKRTIEGLRHSLGSDVFAEVALHAVRTCRIRPLLCAAVNAGLFPDAVNLVFLFAQHHGLLGVMSSISNSPTVDNVNHNVGNSELKYLTAVLRTYEDRIESLNAQEFSRLVRLDNLNKI